MSDRANVLVDGSHAQYRASSAGACIKALAAQRMGMDGLPPSEDMKRRFADGHLHEDSILEAVELDTLQHVVRKQEEWRIDISSRVAVVGHVDGILSDDLRPVEAKSASQDSFADWDRGITSWFSSRHTYAVQWTLTLAAYDRTTGIYAVKNKNTGRTVVREVGMVMPLEKAKLRLLKADLDGRRGILPECDIKDHFCNFRYLHDDKPTVEAELDETLEGLAAAYIEARENEQRAEAVKKELGRRIAEAMGDREKVETGSHLVTMTPWTRKTLDKDKLVAAVGDLTPYENMNSGVYARVKQLDGEGE